MIKVNKPTETGADIERVSQAVSVMLKRFRQQQKISLDEMSRRAGVSKGMLVEIEKGAANPSIGILCKIAAACGISVADIVNVTAQPPGWVISPSEMPVLWQGERGGKARLLAGTKGPDMLELWRWEIYAGETYVSAGHPPGTMELLHVEQGALRLRLEDHVLQVNTGCAVVARTDTPHHYECASDGKVIFTLSVMERH